MIPYKSPASEQRAAAQFSPWHLWFGLETLVSSLAGALVLVVRPEVGASVTEGEDPEAPCTDSWRTPG